MGKADYAFSTIDDWIWLNDALREATKVLGSQALAKSELQGLLAIGQLPWTCMRWEGHVEPWGADEPQLGSRMAFMICFWTAPSHWIDWADNSAGENVTSGAKAMGIRVSCSHLLAALPRGACESRGRSAARRGAAAWVAAEVRAMKAAGGIPQGIKMAEFAREIEHRMKEAAAFDKSLRPLTAKSLRNRLPEWGLWPAAAIE